jgi:hypothetical protein
VLLESLIAPLYLCMRVTVEALEDWRYVDAIDRVLVSQERLGTP